ncbi:MAG: sulfatase-like hydrolase/transferase [Chitinophagales bacterium]|nr:sulfatase-like hydrolase/transferase [Chitinophagales bacterium]
MKHFTTIVLLSFLFSFTTLLQAQTLKPNILLIIVDDGRYADYTPTGGPSWFQSPSINRIADEGVNFKNTFVALSLCGPSRVSILTGLYPHHSGYVYNTQVYDTSILTIARILKDNGYYTGIVGKFINSFDEFPKNDFSYYFANDGNGNYNPKTFSLNGVDTLVNENPQKAINEFGIHFLESAPVDSPFFLMFTARAPHVPYTAYPGYENAYHSDTVLFPNNFNGYEKNYPNYLYYDNLYLKDSIGCVGDIQTYYETLIGVEEGVDSIFSFLENKNVMDSTLIIFMSDNGIFIGEHNLQKKRLAYEESIHIPLFIRYPKWFQPNTIVEDEFAMNIDIFPTLLEAAGITDTFNDDGISLHDLALKNVERKEFMYEYFSDTLFPAVPDIRAVRTFNYKYIWSSCDQTTEEFYDLQNDIKEDSNLIFKIEYQTVIQTYRDKLDSLRTALGDDKSKDTVITCSLLNADTLYLNSFPIKENDPSFFISPNPTQDFVTFHFSNSKIPFQTIVITDLAGRILLKQKIFLAGKEENSTAIININELPAGVYLVKAEEINVQSIMLMIMH